MIAYDECLISLETSIVGNVSFYKYEHKTDFYKSFTE